VSRFSVLIPVFNGADFLEDALASIAGQTLKDVSVVVSDNASADGTPAILERWKDRLDLRVVRQPATLPMQAHFNAILAEIRTERYMLLCHDDYLASDDALRLADEALDRHPDAPAVYCDLTYVNARKRPLAMRRFPRGSRFDADAAGRDTLRTARNMFGIPIGVRTAALGDQRYDPQFHYAMDVDLSWAMARGQTLAHIPEPLIANRYRAGNTTWALLDRSRAEFLALARKYEVPMGPAETVKLTARTWFVNQQKRLFGLYGRAVSWLG
jgi:glycosyltransferase involved in cell wall biosynthesis